VDKPFGKIGRKNICNLAGMGLDKVTFDWFGKTLTADLIRKNLKRTFCLVIKPLI